MYRKFSRRCELCASLTDKASLDSSVLSKSLTGILEIACDNRSPSSDGLVRLDNALPKIAAMTAMTCRHGDLGQAILDVMSSGLLDRFATQGPLQMCRKSGYLPTDVCPSIYMETMTRMHQCLIVTILSNFIRSPLPAEELNVISLTLLEKQTKLCTAAAPCADCGGNSHLPTKASISMFEAGSTPRANSISHNWRENMVRELARDANREHELVIRMVGEICRDLELRCHDAERPYREEQVKSRDLEAELDSSRAKVPELEVKLRAQISSIDDLEKEKDVLLEQMKASEKSMKDQAEDLVQVRHDFDQVKRASQKAAQAAAGISRQQDLAYMATLTGKDEIIEEQASKLIIFENRISELEDHIADLTANGVQDAEILGNNQTTIRTLNEDLASANELVATKQVELDRLVETEAALIRSEDEAAARAREALNQKDSTIRDLGSERQAAKTKMEEIQREFDTYASTKDAKTMRLEESHRSACEKLQVDLKLARNDAAVTREKHVSEINGLQTKVKKIRRERDYQSKKLAEAQELGRRFMAVMGNSNNQATLCRTVSWASEHRSADVASHEISSPEKRAISTDPASPLGSGRSNLSGPTPKRTKTHRDPQTRRTQGSGEFKTPAAKAMDRRYTMEYGRTPLADLGPTHNLGIFTPTQRISWEKSPERVHGRTASTENLKIQRWNSDDESFGGGDIFTSTDQQQLSALRSGHKTPQMPKNISDETTTEF